MKKNLTLFLLFFLCLSNAFAQNWIQMGADIDGAKWGRSGGSVSMSSDGNTVAIGAAHASQDAGHVRVYFWNGTTWTQKGPDIDGEAINDVFGCSVSMSSDGNTVAVGARHNNGNGVDAGHVRVYSWSGTSWTQKGADIDGDAVWDKSGFSVSISSDGNTVAAGAPYNDGNGQAAGHVRVFSWSGSSWKQKGLDIDGEAEGDASGWSVSMSSDGNTVAVGAPYNEGNGADAGHVRVHSWSGTTWTQKGADIDGEDSLDYSGTSVSMSSDGNTVGIGAHSAPYLGRSGQVRVYSWTSLAWKQKGIDIDGEANDDHSGWAICISSVGNTLAVGAKDNDGNGNSSGHVRVYRYGWPTGIDAHAISSAKIYPNPSSNNFTLDLGQVHQGIELKIMDVLGQIISTKKVESASQVEFEITGKSGVYLVEIGANDHLLNTVRVIKE